MSVKCSTKICPCSWRHPAYFLGKRPSICNRLVNLLEIPIVEGFLVPFIHFSVGLLGVVTRARPQGTGISNHVSLADSKRILFDLLACLFLRKVKICRLIVGAWPQILVTVCCRSPSNDLIRVPIVSCRIEQLSLLLLLDRSFQNQDIVRGTSRELLKRGAFVVLKIIVRGAWYCRV